MSAIHNEDRHKLPSVQDCGLDAEGISLWNFILEAEEHARKQVKGTAASRDPLIGIRVLGFFLLDFLGPASYRALGSAPYLRVALEAKSCLGKDTADERSCALQKLGLDYRNHSICVFRSNAGPWPASSFHVSRPSFDRVQADIIQELQNAPQTRSSARRQALLRDGFKCALSGLYDEKSIAEIPELAVAQRAEGDGITVYTQVAHILSESAQDGDKGYAATVFAMLQMFGLEEIAKKLVGSDVNGLHNVITMSMEFHEAFDTFDLWLEPVDNTLHTYDICINRNGGFATPLKSKRITFSVDKSAAAAAEKVGKTLQLPDRTLLALRAACSRVANMSGAAEHIDHILRDLEEIPFLADDGSMADLLSHRISTAVPAAAIQAQR
ncbi:hypothetical protein H0H92_014290 [Tricholoma furcatifolium]|nr:hypothetical protein H0H92_014290 [Tricholoma furcatifolium]